MAKELKKFMLTVTCWLDVMYFCITDYEGWPEKRKSPAELCTNRTNQGRI